MVFLQKMEQNFREKSKQNALKDSSRTITFGELDTISGKIYSFLRSRNIGREDVVLINLPRSLSVVCAMVGVLRSGAAYIVMDAGDPVEKVKYAFNESQSKLLLDADIYTQMMNAEPAAGYEKREPHDLAYVIYTSGTTGHPKGVMQEYGVLDEIIQSHLASKPETTKEDVRVGFLSPLTFTAATAWLLTNLYRGACSCIIPLDTVKHTKRLLSYLKKEQITSMFCTPSLFRLLGRLPASMEWATLGGEAVRELYCEKPMLVNGYAQSETGFVIASKGIDRSYDVTPVGKNRIGKTIWILDENDKPVAPGTDGEICIDNPYFRGYLGHPELTAEVRRNGLYHTGDIGRLTPEGELLVLGRNDDMVKINGNRVEVSEIEEVAKRVTGLSWAGAKAFVTTRAAYVCLYYLEEPGMSSQELRSKLAEHLPNYMIPSRFMKVDSIPQNANGKFSRKLLPEPPAPVEEYEAPATENERILCDAAASVLGCDLVGVNTDFFDVGGDSIRSIALISMLPWSDFTVALVYKGRTPRGMAALYEKNHSVESENLDAIEAEAEKLAFPITDKQLYFFDYQLYTPMSTMYNLPVMMRFLNPPDMDRLARALETVIRSHPVFMTQFFFAEDGVMQHLVPFEPEIRVETCSEAEMVDIMESLVQPYRVINRYLYRIRLFQTEANAYLFLDLHHCISDGTSTNHLIRDIQSAYMGQPLQKDYYYAYLNKLSTHVPDREEGYENYAKSAEEAEWCGRLAFDQESRDNARSFFVDDIPVSKQSYHDLAHRYGAGKNPYIIASTILALAASTGQRDIILTWIYDGRVGELEKSLVGLVIEDRPLWVRISDDLTLSGFFKTILKKIEAGVAYHEYSLIPEDEQIVQDDIVCVIYQSSILDFNAEGELKYQIVNLPSRYDASENVMNVELVDAEPFSKLAVVYNSVLYREETACKFKNKVLKAACRLAEYRDRPDTKIVSLMEGI